jgi:hypothetical protein
MAITIPILRHIREVSTAQAGSGHGVRRALSLGYPDILAPYALLREWFGAQRMAGVGFRTDSDEVIRWHGETGIDRLVDAYSFFRAIGYALEVVDIAEIRGGERVMDLNHPCDPALHAHYDLIMDGGTLEHCFNIGQAARNIAEMTAPGGYIIGANPMAMFNHGFYNLNPTWYADFYGQNGFELLSLHVTVLGQPDALFEVPRYNRIQQVPQNAMLLMLAKRTVMQPIDWPIQMKYRLNPSLTG